LWTRAEPEAQGENVQLLVQVSSVEDFSNILVEGLLNTGPDSDYTVRTYLRGLTADTCYYYRFLGPKGASSRVGRTRTAPKAAQEKNVSMAFASCQSYEQAYYGAWARMIANDKAALAEDKIQFVLHLGDFIYERSWNKHEDGREQSRYVPPFPNGEKTDINRYAVSLEDYRHLYKTYLSDPWLQEARARWPFICIWDDHEFCDNNFQSYNTYKDTPASQPQRKLDANRAWAEYIPAVLNELEEQPAHDFEAARLHGEESADNSAAVASLCIYRKLNWGKHLDVVLTDTRSYRSAPCLPKNFAQSLDLPMNTAKLVAIADGGRDYDGGNPPEFLPYGDGKTPNIARERAPGSCLGDAQRVWFLNTMASSTATWKLWGNALPLIPMNLDMSSIPFANIEDSIFNLDAWGGYPGELKYLMNYFSDNGVSGLVSFSGDHHLHGAGTLYSSPAESTAQPVLFDFSCAGISSSPAFTNFVGAADNGSSEYKALVYTETDDKTKGMEFGGRQLLPVWNMTMLDGVLASMAYSGTGLETLGDWLGPNKANPGLKYMDTTANGYGLAQFTAQELKVQLVSMENLRRPFTQVPNIKNIAHFRVAKWDNTEEPSLEGPNFIGAPPFPF
jgi:alkaline phosphatase D